MHTLNYQQYPIQENPYSPIQTASYFMHDPCIMCHHASRHQSILSTVANALFNYYLFPQAYVYVVSSPILTNSKTTIITSESPVRQDTLKANANAKLQFSPAYKANNSLKDLIENMMTGLSQFKKSTAIFNAAKNLVREAECLTTQVPESRDQGAVEAFITAVEVIQNEFIQLQNQMNEFDISQAKSLKEAMINIKNAKNALEGSFAELAKVYELQGELREVFNSRREFWNSQEKLAESTYDFKAYNLETEKQIAFDFFLLSFIEDEITRAKSQQVSIPSHLGILSSITDDSFAKKVASALKKFDMAPLSAKQVQEIKTAIIDVMLEVERKEITSFLKSLKNTQEEFASNDYMTVVEHYGETLIQFENVAKKLGYETVDTYIEEWNDLLIEFDPVHQHLLKLIDAEKALKKLSDETREWLSHKADNEGMEALIKLNDLYSFRYKKNSLKDAADIEAYINTIYSFMEEVKKQIEVF